MEKETADKKSFRKKLRLGSTDAEHLLWRHLRARRLQGFKFRRQHRFGTYVVDFYCPLKQMVIELDGGQHAVRQFIDQRRTEYLESRGLKVLRFWNNDVLGNLEGVLETIWAHLMGHRPSFDKDSTLSPALPLHRSTMKNCCRCGAGFNIHHRTALKQGEGVPTIQPEDGLSDN